MSKPVIAITMGDPAGVGPEICLQALKQPGVLDSCVPVVFGDADILNHCAETLGEKITCPVVSDDNLASLKSACKASIVHIPSLNLEAFQPAKINSHTGICTKYAFKH